MANAKTSKYEAMFLVSQQHMAEAEGSIKLCRAVVEKHGGTVLVAKKWDERKLCYEIGKMKRGLYIIVYFTAPGTSITPLERDVKLSEDFTRVMITKADHLSLEEMEAVEPQPIAPPQPERAPWDMPPMGGGYGDRPPRDSRDSRPPRRRDDAEAAVGKE